MESLSKSDVVSMQADEKKPDTKLFDLTEKDLNSPMLKYPVDYKGQYEYSPCDTADAPQHATEPSTSHQALQKYPDIGGQQNQEESHPMTVNVAPVESIDYFNLIPNEIVLNIFKYLPKESLLQCARVSRRFNRCANDGHLWTCLDLGGCTLLEGAVGNIMERGVVVLRLALATINSPIMDENFLKAEPKFISNLKYLDLSMATIEKPSLKLLLSHCRQLKKLSLEHVPVNDEICTEIGNNIEMETLNLTMCLGIEAWSIRNMLGALTKLESLNMSWTALSVEAITSLISTITPNVKYLNVSGFRKAMFNTHLKNLAKRCPDLLELDLSDCSGLTHDAVIAIGQFKMLKRLSLSRCYSIPASSFMELSKLESLSQLSVFGVLSEASMIMLQNLSPHMKINKEIHSVIARPTVAGKHTFIWGLKTRY